MTRSVSPRAEASRRYYEKHKDEIAEKRRGRREEIAAARREHRERVQSKVEAAKDVPCADCGVKYPPYVMDFDHVRGEKVQNVARMVGDQRSWEAIAAEIAKCDVVCSNCHRERTHGAVLHWGIV